MRLIKQLKNYFKEAPTLNTLQKYELTDELSAYLKDKKFYEQFAYQLKRSFKTDYITKALTLYFEALKEEVFKDIEKNAIECADCGHEFFEIDLICEDCNIKRYIIDSLEQFGDKFLIVDYICKEGYKNVSCIYALPLNLDEPVSFLNEYVKKIKYYFNEYLEDFNMFQFTFNHNKTLIKTKSYILDITKLIET